MCDTIVAVGSAAEEGFTLFGKNSDREPDEAQNILIFPREKHDLSDTVQCAYLTVPQVPETARYYSLSPSGCLVQRWEPMNMEWLLTMKQYLPNGII